MGVPHLCTHLGILYVLLTQLVVHLSRLKPVGLIFFPSRLPSFLHLSTLIFFEVPLPRAYFIPFKDTLVTILYSFLTKVNRQQTRSALDWIFSSINVAKPSDSHSSLQSFAPTSKPNQACEISCARRTRILASPERRDWERNTRLGLNLHQNKNRNKMLNTRAMANTST